jgi:GNAT superfamily N-acetyltransferase
MPSLTVLHGLSPIETAALRRLFDAEYLGEFGEWDADLPYGYAPHDVHVVAYDGAAVVGHVGFQRRRISVGGAEVVVGGTGGVLVAPAARGSGLGRALMTRAQAAMREEAVDFGYLGCREAVAPFYARCGWRRVAASERSLSRLHGGSRLEPAGTPILVCAAGRPLDDWPGGAIDLNGLPW